MTLAAGFTLAVLAVTIVLIAVELYSPDVLLAAALVVLMASGVVDVTSALAGFGNPAIATVAALFIVAAGVRATGALEIASRSVFRGAQGLIGAAGRLTAGTAAVSALVSNTPVVAMAMPAVTGWAERHRISPSRLLIPLSYASILGGVCTLIGTSTNLVSDGLLRSDGLAGLGFFELAWVGVPGAVLGTLYLTLLAPRLLGDRVPIRAVGGDVRRYTAEMELSEESPLVGRSVEEAGLRHLPGLFLVRVERHDGAIFSPVGPSVRLFAGDRLTFAGSLETMVDLRKFRGLIPVAGEERSESEEGWELHEAVVSPGSPLVGTGIREAGFRGRYNAAIIAVHRHGERVTGKIGDIVLRPGDTLLLEAAPGFEGAYRNSRDFYLVSHVEESAPPRHRRLALSVLVLAAMVALAALNVVPIVVAAMAAAIGMVALRCLTPAEAKRSVDWSVLVMIGSALGIAAALEASGAADLVARIIVEASAAFGVTGLLGGVFLAAMLLTELVSNTAAIALMFPIAVSAAGAMSADPRPFVIAVTVAASLSLSTPIGYQTNLMVYGPGGYRFTDFTRVGLPLQLALAALALLIIPAVWPLR